MRTIDADALIKELNNSHYPGAPYIDAGISIAIGKVCDAPTIEPDPCEDAVSRADLLHEAENMENEHTRDVIKGLATMLPPVTPKCEEDYCPMVFKPEPCDSRENDKVFVDKDAYEQCRFEYINACKITHNRTPDTRQSDINDAYAVIKALQPIFGGESF